MPEAFEEIDMDDAETGPYVIRYGDVWHVRDGSDPGSHVCDGSQNLAVAYDSVDGILFKHGHLGRVQEWAAKTRRTFSEAGAGDLAAAITVISFPVAEETVNELNACVATTGRVLRLPEALERIAAARPDLLARPRYPAD